MFKLFILFLLVFWALPMSATTPEVTGYELDQKAGGGVTLRLKLDQMVDFTSFTLANPDRVVIDIVGAKWHVGKTANPQDALGFVKKIRAGTPKPENLRVVLDLTKPVKIKDAFVHVPSRQRDPHYLVVQLKELAAEKPVEKEAAPLPEKKNFAVKKETPPPPPPLKKSKSTPKPVQAPKVEAAPPAFAPVPKVKPERFVIVIDPGHGGVDPGAIGAEGAKEKEITLRYAKHLRDVLLASERYEVVMTREGDNYIPLRGRVKKAQDAHGQLFISLHADSHPEPNMRGLSVYTLSENASDEEAQALADRENKKDIITGIDLSHQSKDVAEVLIDLAQRDTKNTSAKFAELVVAELGTEAKLLKHSHRFAGFAVLKGVTTPSALVEMGYLSNPKEEAQLVSTEYEDRLIHAIARAVDTYCDQYAPKETTL